MEVNFCFLMLQISQTFCTAPLSLCKQGETTWWPQQLSHRFVFEAWSQPKPVSINRKLGLLAASAKVLIRALPRKLALSCKNAKSCHQQIRRT